LQNHKISWDSTPKQILKKTKYYDENIEKNKNMYNIVKFILFRSSWPILLNEWTIEKMYDGLPQVIHKKGNL